MTAGAGGLGRARAYALVAAAALLCYAGTLVNGFVWDDRDLILDDPRTHRLRDAASFLVRPFGLGVGDRRNAAYYRPVVNMSFALEYALFGARPWAYHLTNTVLHVAASCGVLAMVAALAGSGRAGALAGLAFALHPVHSESVSWVSGRTDLLACVLMVWCTARLCRTRGKGMVFSYLALAAFAFAVFSKEVALTPGKVCEVSVDCWSTSIIFNTAHRIRVSITSSNYPRFDRNPGTGQPWTDGCKFVKQTNKIYCDTRHPSHIILPVVTSK